MDSKVGDFNEDRRRERDFLYAVLNLPIYANDSDIKERHRALSLVFHPDKQRDEHMKESATQKFLEVQAAYEILSDPFLREVYDTLGYDGLKLNFPAQLKSLPKDELRPALREYFYESRMSQLQTQVNSRATVTCSLDARELIYDGWLAREWYTDLSERVSSTKFSILSLRHSFSKRIGPQTRLQVISKLGQAVDVSDEVDMDVNERADRFVLLRGNVVGVVSHQYSPTKQFQVKANLMNLRTVRLSWKHEDKLNYISVSAPLRPTFRLPPLTLTFRRRLYRETLTMGALDLIVKRGAVPVVNVGFTKPAVAKKESWFASGWATGFSLRSAGGPVAYMQWQALCNALSTAFRVGFEYNIFTGLGGTLEGAWASENGEADVAATVLWDVNGTVLRMTLSYLGQTLVLPITLADVYAPRLALLTALVPASAFVLTDYFVLRSRRAAKRAKRRIDHENARQDQLQEKRAQAEAVSMMLKDSARRILQNEKNNDGLVILEALYFPLDDTGAPITEFGIDVTTPVQALVHDGQLFIPGGRSKSLLRGFYDPLPQCAKRLSVRYEFRSRMHYAESGERTPLVLPLESHLVEHSVTKKE